MKYDLISTIKGSLLENFYPKGWDLQRMKECLNHDADDILERQDFWHKDFTPVIVEDRYEWFLKVGHEMAMEVKEARDKGQKVALILPAGPIDQYAWFSYFINEWQVNCDHVYGFSMDDFCDDEGNVAHIFDEMVINALYKPLGKYTIPESQRNFATKENLPTYPEKLAKIQAEGGKVILVHGVGRSFHIAFDDPHFAEDHDSEESFLNEKYRIAAKLHPLTIEQNAITSYRSDFTKVSTRGNTMCTGLMIEADRVIGGCRESYSTGSMWQGAGVWMTLRYGPNRFVPCSYIPTIPGNFYVVRDICNLKGPYYPTEK